MMSEQQFELLLERLDRIARALEAANLRDYYPSPSTTINIPSGSGWTCQKCLAWVMNGQSHACNNFGSGSVVGG